MPNNAVPGKYEPDVNECRTWPVAAGIYDCLLGRPSCRFALRFGYGLFCRHPNCKDFHREAIRNL